MFFDSDSDSESDRNDFSTAGAKWDPTGSVARCANRPLKDVLIAYYIRSACLRPLGETLDEDGNGNGGVTSGGSQLLLVSGPGIVGMGKARC